jgi:hypothetical protein
MDILNLTTNNNHSNSHNNNNNNNNSIKSINPFNSMNIINNSEKQQQHQKLSESGASKLASNLDLLKCGTCSTEFLLSDIVIFIQHKNKFCKKIEKNRSNNGN